MYNGAKFFENALSLFICYLFFFLSIIGKNSSL